jgi:hypothetical protein
MEKVLLQVAADAAILKALDLKGHAVLHPFKLTSNCIFDRCRMATGPDGKQAWQDILQMLQGTSSAFSLHCLQACPRIYMTIRQIPEAYLLSCIQFL